MKVEIEGNKVIIKGNKFGKDKWIEIYYSDTDDGIDYFNISLHRGIFDCGVFKSIKIYKDITMQGNEIVDRG